jgi:hypothetical protein
VADKLIAKRRDMLEDAESHIREHERRERRQREAAEEAEARRDVPDWDAVVTGNARACGILPSEARCLVPGFDGALFSSAWRDALWDRFYTAAPRRRRRSVERYNIVKRA